MIRSSKWLKREHRAMSDLSLREFARRAAEGVTALPAKDPEALHATARAWLSRKGIAL